MKRKSWLFVILCLVLVATLGFVGCSSPAPAPVDDDDDDDDDDGVPEITWPEATITVACGWAAGGSSDLITRALAVEMQEYLGVTINAINTTGALGAVGAGEVHRAPKDGYNWFGGAAVHGTWPVLGHSDLSWTDFYSYLAVMFPTTVYVKNDAPWETLDDMLEEMRANPTSYKYGHPGAGSNGEIFATLLTDAADITGIVSIPYTGGREAANYLLAGEVDFVSVTMGDCADMAVAGDIRPLANLYDQVVEFQGITIQPITDDLPQLAPYIAINPFFGIYIPRETPEEIVVKIAEAFEYAVAQTRFKETSDAFAGILEPKIGQPSDEMMSRIEAARSVPLYQFGIAENDPADFGIKPVTEFQWPPHDRAKNVKPWPAGL